MTEKKQKNTFKKVVSIIPKDNLIVILSFLGCFSLHLTVEKDNVVCKIDSTVVKEKKKLFSSLIKSYYCYFKADQNRNIYFILSKISFEFSETEITSVNIPFYLPFYSKIQEIEFCGSEDLPVISTKKWNINRLINTKRLIIECGENSNNWGEKSENLKLLKYFKGLEEIILSLEDGYGEMKNEVLDVFAEVGIKKFTTSFRVFGNNFEKIVKSFKIEKLTLIAPSYPIPSFFSNNLENVNLKCLIVEPSGIDPSYENFLSLREIKSVIKMFPNLKNLNFSANWMENNTFGILLEIVGTSKVEILNIESIYDSSYTFNQEYLISIKNNYLKKLVINIGTTNEDPKEKEIEKIKNTNNVLELIRSCCSVLNNLKLSISCREKEDSMIDISCLNQISSLSTLHFSEVFTKEFIGICKNETIQEYVFHPSRFHPFNYNEFKNIKNMKKLKSLGISGIGHRDFYEKNFLKIINTLKDLEIENFSMAMDNESNLLLNGNEFGGDELMKVVKQKSIKSGYFKGKYWNNESEEFDILKLRENERRRVEGGKKWRKRIKVNWPID